MSDETYKPVFFTVPSRILELPGLTMSYLRVYETIFQFWHRDLPCYLSNEKILERVGLKSPGGLREAFAFFEKHGEMLRTEIDGKRYIIQPERRIKIEQDSPVDNFDTPVTNVTPPRHKCDS